MNATASTAIAPPITAIAAQFDVNPLIRQLEAAPELWNQHTLRQSRYGAPHMGISDIWVRFNDWSNYDGDPVKFTTSPHKSVWYPCISKIPAAWSLARKVYRIVRGERLGGILITKIPPGCEVKPHTDTAWHASYYEKFAIQIKGNKDQAFCFEDCSLSPMPGELFTFDNSRLHWVTNDSDEDRITLIICIRRTP